MSEIYQDYFDADKLWIYNDGGRAAAGFKGTAGDCVARAIAIATGLPYKDVYNELAERNAKAGKSKSARNGVTKKVYKAYLRELGFTWVPTMFIGSGTKVHLSPDELPLGKTLIAEVSKHITCVIDGTIHDTYDPSRNATRAVYGYWLKPE